MGIKPSFTIVSAGASDFPDIIARSSCKQVNWSEYFVLGFLIKLEISSILLSYGLCIYVLMGIEAAPYQFQLALLEMWLFVFDDKFPLSSSFLIDGRILRVY